MDVVMLVCMGMHVCLLFVYFLCVHTNSTHTYSTFNQGLFLQIIFLKGEANFKWSHFILPYNLSRAQYESTIVLMAVIMFIAASVW